MTRDTYGALSSGLCSLKTANNGARSREQIVIPEHVSINIDAFTPFIFPGTWALKNPSIAVITVVGSSADSTEPVATGIRFKNNVAADISLGHTLKSASSTLLWTDRY